MTVHKRTYVVGYETTTSNKRVVRASNYSPQIHWRKQKISKKTSASTYVWVCTGICEHARIKGFIVQQHVSRESRACALIKFEIIVLSRKSRFCSKINVCVRTYTRSMTRTIRELELLLLHNLHTGYIYQMIHCNAISSQPYIRQPMYEISFSPVSPVIAGQDTYVRTGTNVRSTYITQVHNYMIHLPSPPLLPALGQNLIRSLGNCYGNYILFLSFLSVLIIVCLVCRYLGIRMI